MWKNYIQNQKATIRRKIEKKYNKLCFQNNSNEIGIQINDYETKNVSHHTILKCSGKNCNNAGSTILKIIYLHKNGLFCESCANELIHCGLVEGVEN